MTDETIKKPAPWLVHGDPCKRSLHVASVLRILRIRYPISVVYAPADMAHKLHLVLDSGTTIRSIPEDGLPEKPGLMVSLWEAPKKSWEIAAHRKGVDMVEVME